MGGASPVASWGVVLVLSFSVGCRSSAPEPADSVDADGSNGDVADADGGLDAADSSLDATGQDGLGDALDVVVPDGGDAFHPVTAWRCREPCTEVDDCTHPEQSVCEEGLCQSNSYACVNDFDCYLILNGWIGTEENACEKDSDCKSGSVCIDYEGHGFCTWEYVNDDDCWLFEIELRSYENGDFVKVCVIRGFCMDPFFSENEKRNYQLCRLACPQLDGYSPSEPVCNELTGRYECTDESCPGKCLDGICRCTSDSHCPDAYHPKCVAGICSCTADSCAAINDSTECMELTFPDGKRVP